MNWLHFPEPFLVICCKKVVLQALVIIFASGSFLYLNQDIMLPFSVLSCRCKGTVLFTFWMWFGAGCGSTANRRSEFLLVLPEGPRNGSFQVYLFSMDPSAYFLGLWVKEKNFLCSRRLLILPRVCMFPGLFDIRLR